MGDRYELKLHCAYCNKLNKEIWYAPTCGSYTFGCGKCGKTNFIKNFQAVKTNGITGNDLFDAFIDATNVSWEDKDLKRIEKECIEQANKIKKSN